MTYTAIIQNSRNERKTIQISASSQAGATSEALAHCAAIQRETGVEWRVVSID